MISESEFGVFATSDSKGQPGIHATDAQEAARFTLRGKSAVITPDILTIQPPGKDMVIRVDPEGRLFWHGREVETDDDFRAAMLELAKRLVEVGAL